jgi:ABC-2 type transport system permease protein
VKAFARKFGALVSVNFANALTYRAELLLWTLSGALPLIMAGIYVEWSRQLGDAAPMTPAEHAQYFLCTFIVRQLTLVWVVWEFENELVQGRLSHYLLQPIDPGWRYFCAHVAERVPRIPVLLMLGLMFYALFPTEISAWPITTRAITLGLMAICLTFLMRFCVQYAFAMLAFWTERAHSVEQLWYLPYLFLSGLLIPPDYFPEPMREVLYYTPFPYLIEFPSKVMMGVLSNEEIARGMLATIGWTVIFFFAHRCLWRLGLRKYSAMGA